MYKVVIEKKVQKELSKITQPYFQNIIEALKSLALNPRPAGYKKLKGRPGYRIRIANYRIIYILQENELLVLVLTIAHRKDIYEK